jgi:hypothetical protein
MTGWYLGFERLKQPPPSPEFRHTLHLVSMVNAQEMPVKNGVKSLAQLPGSLSLWILSACGPGRSLQIPQLETTGAGQVIDYLRPAQFDDFLHGQISVGPAMRPRNQESWDDGSAVLRQLSPVALV